MSEQISKFRFKSFRIINSSIKINDDNLNNVELSIDLKQEGNVLNNNTYESILDVYVFNESKTLEVKVKLRGEFEFDNQLDENQKAKFFEINAPAILFPYLRAYISSITGLSGISPIILPTINLSARGKKD